MHYVIPFDHSLAAQTSLVGGKARNLHVLTKAGFPVPGGFVVTSEAYDRFIRAIDGVHEFLQELDFDNHRVLRDQCDSLRARLSATAMPQAVADELRAVVESPATTREAAFAVRSSSTFEDLASAAFAGQHDTFLNVRGSDAIINRVRDCFVSLWGDRAVLYRHQQGFGQLEAKMAVVIQEQIACDAAGVGFSIHPVSGRLDRLVINANFGLGESVVSGDCEVDEFELDRSTLNVVATRIGEKQSMHVAVKDGSSATPVPDHLRRQVCLSELQVREVGQLLRSVHDLYGWPQDIEWGWKDGQIYLFQSRPVTMFPARWTRDESAERFPNPMSPLSWQFMCDVFNQSMSHSLTLMGLPAFQGEWFSWFDNYVYGNQTAVELISAVRPIKARNVYELVAEIPQLRDQYGWVIDLPAHWGRDLDHYLIQIGRLSAVSFDELSEREIWDCVTDLMRVATDYFRPNIAISMTQSFLHRLLVGLVQLVVGPEKHLEIVDGLLAGIETKTALVNLELHELAMLARRTPQLAAAMQSQDGRVVWDQRLYEVSPEFSKRLAKLLVDHGHREVDIDYREPTWSQQPAVVLDSVALILRGESIVSPSQLARQQRIRFVDAELQFLSGLPSELRFFFRELIRLTRVYTSLDDFEHYQTTRINPIARRAAIAIGRRFCERGFLDQPEDIFFANKSDIERVILSNFEQGVERLSASAKTAKLSFESAWHRTPTWSPESSQDMAPAVDQLRGVPGSPGKATGDCFLVRSPADFAKFPKGAVLVARTTNPAWTPLFYSASGLITESGGALSHGAVTAREMRLPAVMSVRGAMSTLRDGQTVCVDGTLGLVNPS